MLDKLTAYPVRPLVLGVCFSGTTASLAWLVITVLQLIFPEAFNSIEFLVASIPIAIVTAGVSLGLGFVITQRLARRLSQRNPADVIVIGAIIGLEFAWLLDNFWPFIPQLAFWTLLVPLFALAFIIVDGFSILRTPRWTQIISSAVIILLLGPLISATSGQGTRKATKEALNKVGYTLYVPAADSGFSQPNYLSATNSNADQPFDFQQGVTFEYRGNVKAQVYLTKRSGIDANTGCHVAYAFSVSSGNDTVACTLIDQSETIKIYLETRTDSNDTVIHRYYGVTPTTIIATNIYNPATGSIDGLRTQQFLKALQPVSVATLLSTLHATYPKDF